MSDPGSILPKVLYINLDRRTDRRQHIEAELDRLGLMPIAERLPAIPHQFGILGCGRSHLAALRKARESGWERVLILEDDFQAEVEPEAFWEALKGFMATRGNDFDVVMLAHHITASEPADKLVVRVLAAQTASAYIVHQAAYDRLIELYEHAMLELERTAEHWNWANDQVWKRLQPQMRWFAFKPRLGRQIASWSDTANQFHDYNV
jgi:GR25 family glycosyltransferase involved in LPS biosynthesis